MTKDEVFSQLENDFVLIAQYVDDPKDAKPAKNLKRMTNGKTSAVPLYMIVDVNGKEIDRLIPPNNVANLTAKEFAEFMREAKAKFVAKFGQPKSGGSEKVKKDDSHG